MAEPRQGWSDPRDVERCLMLERRALRALVGRLLIEKVPYLELRSLCHRVTSDVVRPGPLFHEHPGLRELVAEALDSVGTLIDEMVERPGRDDAIE